MKVFRRLFPAHSECPAVSHSSPRRALRLLALAAPVLFAACDGFGDAMTAHTDVVARAAGKELKVEEAAQLLASNPQIPADPQVVGALADVWVDYTLLATAAAEDPSLAAINIDEFTAPVREQMVIFKLRDQVIRPDTVFTPAELRQRWATEGPGAEIRARHILLRIPTDADPAQRDSIRQLATSLRERASAGEDFAALATEYSQDPGSAQRGGDLGFFSRGRMVAPFDEAAFALQPGEISDIVESPFGYHIIRVEERRQQDLGEQEEQFRQFLVQRSAQDAETAYLDSLSTAANVQIRPDGLELVRGIAQQPDVTLRGRSAQRVIATYRGGELTAGEFVEFLRTQPGNAQQAFATASDEQVEPLVQQLVRKELLLGEAAQRQVQLTAAEQDSLRTQARAALNQLVQAAGFAGARGGAAGIEAQVRELLQGAISGTRQLVPLGQLSFVLRDLYEPEVNRSAFPQVVAALEQLRPAQPVPGGVLPGPGISPNAPGVAPGAVSPPVPQGEVAPEAR